MYIRQCFRTVEGERRAYWALVESVRTERGPRQNVIAWLGALDEAGRLGVLQAARRNDNHPVSNVDASKFFQQSLFEFEDTPVEPRWVRVTESELIKLLDAAKRRPVDDALTVRTGPSKGELIAKLSDERRSELERTGYERALIYKTAILTGLRFNELQTLLVSDVSFGDVPFVKLQRNNEKNRKGSTVALRSDLAVDLKKWCQAKAKNDLVFYVPAGLLRILDRDLKSAGIPKIDSEGFVVHVHALRHSFGTHLSVAGVSPRVAQAAMRHSNISLTMNTYTDARLLDTSAAVESLPSLPLGESFVAPMVAPATVDLCHLVAISDTLDFDSHLTEKRKNPANPLGIAGFSQSGRRDSNPRPLPPQGSALARLRYGPILF